MRQAGTVGVITDLPAYDLPPNAWSDAMNVRFQGTKVTKMGGNLPILTTGMPANTIPKSVVSYGSDIKGLSASVIYGTSDSLYTANAAIHDNISRRQADGITPDVYDTAGEFWYYTTLSNSLVMTTPNDIPQGLTPKAAYFKNLPLWGKTAITYATDGSVLSSSDWYWRAGKIRTYKNFLVAINMTEGSSLDGFNAENFSQRVRWSDITDINSLPANWDDASTTNSAGFNDLTNSRGILLEGAPLRDSFILYSSKETYAMQYVGGNDVFRFTKLFDNSGILSGECVAEFEGQHFVVTSDDVFIHNGSTKKSIVTNKIKGKLLSEITSTNPTMTKVFANYGSKEIWIVYAIPGVDDTINHASKAAVWSWEFGTWSYYTLPAINDINTINLPTPASAPDTWNAFGNPGDSWDGGTIATQIWGSGPSSYLRNKVVCSSVHGRFYILDTGSEFYGKVGDKVDGASTIVPVRALLERDFIDFDEMQIDPWQNKRVRRLYPQVRGDGIFKISIQGSTNPYEFPSYSHSRDFNIATDIKTDHRVNNKYLSIRFVEDAIGDWAFTGYDLDFILGGRR